MSFFRRFSWIQSVPEEWLGDDSKLIYEMLEKTIKHYRPGDKVVVTIKGASAKINKSMSSFSFENIEEEMSKNDDQTYMIDFLLPERASIVKLKNGRPVNSKRRKVSITTAYQTQDHPFSELFDLKSDRHIIVTAALDIKEIFKSHGINSEEMYNYALETIYKTHKGLEPGPQRLIKPEAKGHPFVTVKKISEDQWELECYERLTRPRFAVTSCFTSSIDS